MRYYKLFQFLILNFILVHFMVSCDRADTYPQTQIANNHVVMKLYLPDSANGYYRATRFDWSGIISSLEFKGHQYFGEWKSRHRPLSHEAVTGPAESFGNPGLGYEEAEVGEGFIRIGIGILEKPVETEYVWNKTYKILDYGVWKVEQGEDWIEFRHELESKDGWGYIYTKRISLWQESPGFSIFHTLENTGIKIIDTDQFNHNFFVIDGVKTGPDFRVSFPFKISTEDDLEDIVEIEGAGLSFQKEISKGSVWLELKGYGTGAEDHSFEIINSKTGAGATVRVDKPLHRMVFWANSNTLCPENFIKLNLDPGEEETWVSEYALFTTQASS